MYVNNAINLYLVCFIVTGTEKKKHTTYGITLVCFQVSTNVPPHPAVMAEPVQITLPDIAVLV